MWTFNAVNWNVVGRTKFTILATVGGQLITLTVHLSTYDALEGARRAGPSATAESLFGSLFFATVPSVRFCCGHTHTHTRLTAFVRDYPCEPVLER